MVSERGLGKDIGRVSEWDLGKWYQRGLGKGLGERCREELSGRVIGRLVSGRGLVKGTRVICLTM
jgi:hypothetical protein